MRTKVYINGHWLELPMDQIISLDAAWKAAVQAELDQEAEQLDTRGHTEDQDMVWVKPIDMHPGTNIYRRPYRGTIDGQPVEGVYWGQWRPRRPDDLEWGFSEDEMAASRPAQPTDHMVFVDRP